jgi:hypothetical protein
LASLRQPPGGSAPAVRWLVSVQGGVNRVVWNKYDSRGREDSFHCT